MPSLPTVLPRNRFNSESQTMTSSLKMMKSMLLNVSGGDKR
ncbi:hypothetical protein ANCCAN_03090 [Ancylostoma caninum]|uniref:Uncharacterized protein n=1 Tax=Ancylostoma caninum TaxID=29170 RepID=A0A368H2P6_ANCCA|nr:hypothetical protein ANCCAN_03090 [Ancylostoma caninum]